MIITTNINEMGDYLGDVKLLAGERIDQLYSQDIQIIQSSQVFSFSLDAVLLANFAKAPTSAKGRLVDLCAGNAPLVCLWRLVLGEKLRWWNCRRDWPIWQNAQLF